MPRPAGIAEGKAGILRSCNAGVSPAILSAGGRYGRGNLGYKVHPRPRGPRGHPRQGQRCGILHSLYGTWRKHSPHDHRVSFSPV